MVFQKQLNWQLPTYPVSNLLLMRFMINGLRNIGWPKTMCFTVTIHCRYCMRPVELIFEVMVLRNMKFAIGARLYNLLKKGIHYSVARNTCTVNLDSTTGSVKGACTV